MPLLGFSRAGVFVVRGYSANRSNSIGVLLGGQVIVSDSEGVEHRPHDGQGRRVVEAADPPGLPVDRVAREAQLPLATQKPVGVLGTGRPQRATQQPRELDGKPVLKRVVGARVEKPLPERDDRRSSVLGS